MEPKEESGFCSVVAGANQRKKNIFCEDYAWIIQHFQIKWDKIMEISKDFNSVLCHARNSSG